MHPDVTVEPQRQHARDTSGPQANIEGVPRLFEQTTFDGGYSFSPEETLQHHERGSPDHLATLDHEADIQLRATRANRNGRSSRKRHCSNMRASQTTNHNLLDWL